MATQVGIKPENNDCTCFKHPIYTDTQKKYRDIGG